jgi:nitrate/nitrite transport system ATP-binding protein
MTILVDIDHIDKVYPLAKGGEYVALKNVDLKIHQGEFVSLIGHSGCGKSTLLNIIAGFEKASVGGVVLSGKQIMEPGPDRMMVFQNYSLLPWLTVRQNIALAVNKVLKDVSPDERKEIIEQHINLVGLRAAADKKPGQLSGGMKQRTAIARALALRPKVLLLDEPFGALDALTRGNLQEQLMEICQEYNMTCVMVTHDVDEALLLSDRVVMLTNGPSAHIGRIMDVKIDRPRKRLEAVNHPDYYKYRGQIITFLNEQKRDKRRKARIEKEVAAIPAVAAVKTLEKTTVTLGYVPTTDAAPLVVAVEKGLFKKYGLEQVELIADSSWQTIADGLANRRLDVAQLLAGTPLAMGLGVGNQPRIPIVTGMVLARNGNAITLNKKFYDQGVRNLKGLKRAIAATPDDSHTFGLVDQTSMGSLLTRYWLASGGIDPDRDIALSILSSAEMKSDLSKGLIDGYLASEPWNSAAVKDDTGFIVATDLEIWDGHQNKVLGAREDWAQANPKTHIAIIKALIEACEYCDDRRNREEIIQLLAQPKYLNVPAEQLRPGFIDPYQRSREAKPEMLLRFNQYYVEQSTCPRKLEALWIMTQMARWGFTPFPTNWDEVLDRVYRKDLYSQAAQELGILDSVDEQIPIKLFDGVVFNPNDPLAYLESLEICRDLRVEEIPIDIVQSRLKIAA